MLKKEYRLRSARDITRVYKRGTYGGADGVLSVRATQSGRPTPRIVVVVGKKVSKKAVIRNRIRRRISGELERNLETLKPGYDIVVSVHQDVSATPAADLAATLRQALSRAGTV